MSDETADDETIPVPRTMVEYAISLLNLIEKNDRNTHTGAGLLAANRLAERFRAALNV